MRRVAWIAVGAAIAIGAIVTVGLLALRNRSTPIEVSYTGAVGTEVGDPGVYRYDTVGFESVDALAGARHDYPDVTAMVLEEALCGIVLRWEPLEQRRDEWWWCGPGLSVSTIVEFHAWFGIGETTETACQGLRLQAQGEGSWEASCTRADTAITVFVEQIGVEMVTIGATPIDTLHVRMTETTTGRTEGTRVTDLWMVPGTTLPAKKRVVDRSTSSSPIGDVTYVEEYSLVLRSLTPTG